MNTIFKRNGEYYVFRNYNIYKFDGTKLTNYTSADYGITYSYCFWLNNTLVLFGSSNKYVLNFDENWNFKIVSTTTGSIAPTSYSWKQCKLGYPKYWKGGLLFEQQTQGELLKMGTRHAGELVSLTRDSIVYRNVSDIKLTPSMVLNDEIFVNTDGEYVGTLKFVDFDEYSQCLYKSNSILGKVQPINTYLVFYDKNLTDISGHNLNGRLVGSYVDTDEGVNFTGGYGITGNINRARGTWEMYCKVNANFTPLSASKWYGCSCLMGCELSGTQQDFAIILDSNGYVCIGYSTESIGKGANIKLNDGKYHHLVLTATDSSLKLYVDGNILVNVAYSMSGSVPATYGIFWNNNDANTSVKGEFKMFRYYTEILTDLQIYQNYTSAIQNY